MKTPEHPPIPADVAAVFEAFPDPVGKSLMAVRSLIFETAEAMDGVGPVTETLKWGEPAYLTAKTRSGSTIRLGVPKSDPNRAAVFFNCNTTLVPTFRDRFPTAFDYLGNRALLLPGDQNAARDVLGLCLAMALRYHMTKSR